MQEERLRGLDTLFDAEREAAKAMAVFQVRDEGYRSEISRTQLLFNAVVKRLDELNLIKSYGSIKTQVVSPPDNGAKIAPKLVSTLGTSCMLGAMLAAGLVWLMERLDRRFRTPEEIRRSLGVSILGHIPLIGERKNKPADRGAAGLAFGPRAVRCPSSQGAAGRGLPGRPHGHVFRRFRAKTTA